MKNIDSGTHTRGTSIFLDDIPVRKGTLFGFVFDSPVAHGRIVNLEVHKASAVPGVIRIFTARDIPGENQIGGIFPDEPLFAEEEVHFQGQPIAFIVARSEAVARKASQHIQLDIEEKTPVVVAREAAEKGQLIHPPRTFQIGDTGKAWSKCAHIFEGTAESGGQEHLYLETQGAYAFPMENGSIRIASSTQGPTVVQRTVAKVLGIPMHKIEVDVTRLGGGFGGKEDQATAWAVMTALASFHLQLPVKISLHRLDDMRMTGKRHPYSSDFRIGLSEDLKIIAFEADYFQNAGAAADLSPAILERTLFHATNSYFVPNVRATANSCRTNLPPNTAFRGFGGPQGMFVMEAAIAKAATELRIPAHVIQEKNLLKDGDEFSYGQIAKKTEARSTWLSAKKHFHFDRLEESVAAFNQKNTRFKKGLALMPICFGISFTKTPMNHSRALVHIYHDGSVGVSTGAVEMGQGVNTKMVQVASKTLSIAPGRIKLETTNTTRVANTSPTAASASADLNGKALKKACEALLKRLRLTAAEMLSSDVGSVEVRDEVVFLKGKPSHLSWEELVEAAFLKRVNLSETAHYATPKIHFDKTKEKGNPFAYHVYGTAILTVTVDCVRGNYEFDSVKIVHDFGKSMNPIIDRGQIEGGLVQGLGWMTMEEVSYDNKGRLLSNALSTYKVPDIYAVPKNIEIVPLSTEGHEMAIFKSKAVGEPPLMYAIGGYFAIENAIRAFNPDYTPKYSAPMTPEKVLKALYTQPGSGYSVPDLKEWLL